MSESELHALLKKIGMIFLYNQGCFIVASEVSIHKDNAIDRHDLDNHYYIDVAGASRKYYPYNPHRRIGNQYWLNVTRGIEAKISRSDFKNGFVCSGCNYHYLLTPMRLVNKSELPKWVGLIEYNKHKFDAKINPQYKFDLKGVRVIKRPVYREITDYQREYAITNMGSRLSSIIKVNLGEYFDQFSDSKEEE